MAAGLSGRALVHFFMLEFLLVGLFALVGQIPWEFWFVASALLYVGLLAYDNRPRLRSWFSSAPRPYLVAATVSLALIIAAPIAFYFGRAQRGDRAQAVSTLEQSLLVVGGAVTTQSHDPFKISVTVGNVGKFPTLKAQIYMSSLLTDAPTQVQAIQNEFAALYADKGVQAKWPLYDDTIAPGQPAQVVHYQTPEITDKVLGDIRAGKKNFFVFLVAQYTDVKTPSGKHMVTEVALRSSPYDVPMRSWSIIAQRSYLSE